MLSRFFCALAILFASTLSSAADASTLSGMFGGYTINTGPSTPISGSFTLDTTDLAKTSQSLPGDEIRWFQGDPVAFSYNINANGTIYSGTFSDVTVTLRERNTSYANKMVVVEACNAGKTSCLNLGVHTQDNPMFSDIDDVQSINFSYGVSQLYDEPGYSLGSFWIKDVVSSRFKYYGIGMASKASDVPLPAALPLFGTALIGLAGAKVRRKKIGA